MIYRVIWSIEVDIEAKNKKAAMRLAREAVYADILDIVDMALEQDPEIIPSPDEDLWWSPLSIPRT